MKIILPQKEILFETIQEEVIIVNLANGNYYSLQAVASELWQKLTDGISLQHLVQLLSDSYGIPKEQAEKDLDGFIEKLSDEKIVEIRLNSEHPTPSAASWTPKGEYAAPEIEIYTDIQDLLTLDPIHEVDEMGWPNPRKDAPEEQHL